MSRHKINIYPTFTIEEPPEYHVGDPTISHFWRPATKSLAPSSYQPIKTTHVSSRVIQPLSSTINFLPPIKGTSFTNFLRSWNRTKPEFNDYPEVKKNREHLDCLDVQIFKDFLFNDRLISMNSYEENNLHDYLEGAVEKDDMLVGLKFFKTDHKLYVSRKQFLKDIDGKVTYYFDETHPSVIEYSGSKKIINHDVIDDESTGSYMAWDYYSELNIIVKRIVNPNQNMIVPAIVVSDSEDKPLEVHCYYKDRYIDPELIKELKPNLLLEDFKAADYFNKRDVEFLDMVMI